jgi:acyl carrier protein
MNLNIKEALHNSLLDWLIDSDTKYTNETMLKDDLGVDKVDLLSIAYDLEEDLDIEFSEEDFEAIVECKDISIGEVIRLAEKYTK